MHKTEGDRWVFNFQKGGRHCFKFIVDGKWQASDQYPIIGDEGNNCVDFVSANQKESTDLREIRRTLSKVHAECNEFLSPIFLHHVQNYDIIQIVRDLEEHAKEDYDAYCVIARANFHHIHDDRVDTTIELPGKINKILV